MTYMNGAIHGGMCLNTVICQHGDLRVYGNHSVSSWLPNEAKMYKEKEKILM